MKMKLKAMALAVTAAAAAFATAPASAQISGDVIKIGFITDMSGVYSDIDGQGGAEAIKMAIADMGGNINGKKIELVWPTTRTRPTSPPARRANGSTSRAWTC
jgi:branched-chain amino acid transport system substrate-binding protein